MAPTGSSILEDDHEAAGQADQGRAEGIDRVAAGGDAHQAGQGRVEGHGHIRLAVAEPGEEHGGQGGHGRGQVRVKEDQGSAGDQPVAVHADRGGAVEAEPAEPEDEHAQGGDGKVMAENRPGLSVLSVLADAGSEHLRADQRADAADHMHGRGAGKVMEAHFGQPAAAPDPVAGDRINEQGDRSGINTVGGEFRALRHGAGYDRGGGGAEDRLEDGVGPQGNARRKNMAVILHDKGIDPAEERGAGSEHDAVAEKPVQRRADAEIHQILHQDIAGVLGPGKTRLTHGKSSLHEEDKRGPEQDPDGVGSRERHTDHSVSI